VWNRWDEFRVPGSSDEPRPDDGIHAGQVADEGVRVELEPGG